MTAASLFSHDQLNTLQQFKAEWRSGELVKQETGSSITFSQAAEEGIWLRRLLCDLVMEATPTKDSRICYPYIHECVQNGQTELQYCQTNDMKVDTLTKPLTKQRSEKLKGAF